MPDYTEADVLENPANKLKLKGYAGRILRLNLTDQTTEIISTYDYVPKYLGGRELATKIFWDEVGPDVECFDPENETIFMTGPTAGTGIPTGGRSEMVGISANNYPSQFAFSGVGGWFGTELKFAGYDGFIVEGKAVEPIYIVIDDDKVEFRPAGELWGQLVHQAQWTIWEKTSPDFKSLVIGPAGEHLCRNASITTSNDNVMAKSGFGAVWGSKNLKAIAVHGTGNVTVADVDKILELRLKMGTPFMRPSPVQPQEKQGLPGTEAPGKWLRGNIACSYGCNQHCCCLMMDTDSVIHKDRKINHLEKCVSVFAYAFTSDVPNTISSNWMTPKNHVLPCKMLAREFPTPDPTEEYFDETHELIKPDTLNFWKPDFDKGNMINELCNEYGLDKWDITIWLLPWLSMGSKEGVLDDLDFGMPIDVENPEFVYKVLTDIAYRRGEMGDLLAEGMARAIRKLGKEKYGDTIYHGRYSNILNKPLDLPISMETAWGHSFHWQGRGYEATITKPTWLASTLELMTSSRDMQTIEHHHDTYENYLKIDPDDPYSSDALVDSVIMNERKGEMKDGVTCCEFQSPDLWWQEEECETFEAATGYHMTLDEMNEAADRGKLLFRAVLIRNHGRDREMEVNAAYPALTIPDPWGETSTWDEFNRLVDLYYEHRNWDKKTAWPYREEWERVGLGDIADEMEKLGKLPVHA